MPILHEPPEPGSYRHVLVRRDVDPINALLVATYGETVESRAVDVDGLGEAHAIFLATDHARDYLVKIGWLDVTETWTARLAASDREAAETTARARFGAAVLAAFARATAGGKPATSATIAKEAFGAAGRAVLPDEVEAVLASEVGAGRVVRKGAGAVVTFAPAPPAEVPAPAATA